MPDDAERWVDRSVENDLINRADGRVQFVFGDSGVGKSVACLRFLQQHVQAGRFGLIVTDKVISESLTVDEAVERTLRNLQPTLTSESGREALSMTSNDEHFILVVEDINRSTQPARLAEKLTSWHVRATTEKDRRGWRILCPVWPRTISQSNDNVFRLSNESGIVVASFSQEEGVRAVKKRHPLLTDLEAETVASALGFDPLLIALHGDTNGVPTPEFVIHSYIERALERAASSSGDYTAGEYRDSLRRLSLEILKRGRLEPRASDVLKWTGLQCPTGAMLRQLLKRRDVIRLEGPTDDQRIWFRHDRVRDYLLSVTIRAAITRDELPMQVMSEPHYAETIGVAVAHSLVPSEAAERVADANPLALFYALKHASFNSQENSAHHVVGLSMRWTERATWRDPANQALRAAILRVLAECESPHIKSLCRAIGGSHPDVWSLRGRFRNGDINAGIQLCALSAPGVTWTGHIELIHHVLTKRGGRLILELDTILRNKRTTVHQRRGALRLTGFIANPEFADSLRVSWAYDSSRMTLLSDYFWASAQCCDDDPVTLLQPIFDAWSAMSDEDKSGLGSPRARFAEHEIRWAFRDQVPNRAIGYFLQRAKDLELRAPMLVMLNGIDNPDVIEFVVRELALLDDQLEETGHSSHFSSTARDEWSRRQGSRFLNGQSMKHSGTPMSSVSRERLRKLWSCKASGKHLRYRAFQFWCTTVANDDIFILRTIDLRSDIGSLALFERIQRSDRSAIPDLMKKLDNEHSPYWWQAIRYLPDDLTDFFDRTLARRTEETGLC